MDANIEVCFEHDGSAKIGDVCLRTSSRKDKNRALDENSPAVIRDVDEDKFARFDVFNTEGNEFCGHLDMFNDRGGCMSFAERRKAVDGSYEVRISDLPAGKLFVVANFPSKRSDLTLAMIKVAKEIHDKNRMDRGWRTILHDDLEQRCSKLKELEVQLYVNYF